MGLDFVSNPLGGENDLLVLLAILWILPWKAVALWKSARREEKWWFIALLVINTFALLEALYIFYFSKRDRGERKISAVEKAKKEKPKKPAVKNKKPATKKQGARRSAK